MSEIWTIECGECRWSGIAKFGDGPGSDKPCSTCSGTGKVMLVVKDIGNSINPKCKIDCDAWDNKCPAEECYLYVRPVRPLTVEEVEELANQLDISINVMVSRFMHLDKWYTNYKGSPVTLAGFEA